MSADALILSRPPAILWVLSHWLGKYLAPQGETLPLPLERQNFI